MEQLYQFTYLPFGSYMTFHFYKNFEANIGTPQEKGFTSTIYLDDILCIGQWFDNCQENVNKSN